MYPNTKNKMETHQDTYKKIQSKVILWIKRIYVISFNIYAWYWLFKLILILNSTNFEDYLLWFFATTGMYFFVFEGNDIFLKKINKVDEE